MPFNHIKSTDWDSTSSDYAKIPLQGPILIPCQRMLAAMDGASKFSSATAILDVGCGPGTAVTLLIDSYGKEISSDTRLIASDFSKGMVDATEAKKNSIVAAGKDVANCWGRLETLVMDGQDLSAIEANSISHVMGSLVYFMLPDPKKGLLEAHRVLKDGGVFACTSWTITVGWMQFVAQAAQKARPGYEFKVGNMMNEQWTTTAGVKTELEAAGFLDVHTEYVEVDWHVEDPQKFSEQMVNSSNPGAKMIVGDFTAEELKRCCEEYLKLLTEHDNVCKGVAVLGIGRK